MDRKRGVNGVHSLSLCTMSKNIFLVFAALVMKSNLYNNILVVCITA